MFLNVKKIYFFGLPWSIYNYDKLVHTQKDLFFENINLIQFYGFVCRQTKLIQRNVTHKIFIQINKIFGTEFCTV